MLKNAQKDFIQRHIGPSVEEQNIMLKELGYKNLDELIKDTVPEKILLKDDLEIGDPNSEYKALRKLKNISKKNKVYSSFIGMGYYGTYTPYVILRNILENPGWYTSYTPYQPEISQGRLESLLNFQTTISDLTGLPIANASLLDEATAAAEAMTMAYHRQQGVDTAIVRIFNTYGPRMHHADGRVVSNFIVQALRNEPITIFGDGQQTRSFCYVDDLVEGFLRLMDTDSAVTGPMNIGNPVEFTIRELAEKTIALTGSKSELVQLPLPQDDPRQRQPDITQAKKVLEWEPKVALEEGLERTIQYFRNRLPELIEA